MPLPPRTRLGSYEIVAALGAGGMGEVHRARDLRLGREVALKLLPSEVSSSADHLTRFEREARTVAGLNHPNIANWRFSLEHDPMWDPVRQDPAFGSLVETLEQRTRTQRERAHANEPAA